MSVERYVRVWDPRQGRWVYRSVQEIKALGTNRIGQNPPGQPGYAPPAAMGTNLIGQGPNINGGAPGRRGFPIPVPLTLPPQQIMQPEPQAMFAQNLGIYYVPIRYDNGTIGLRLTGPPVPGSPMSQLPVDAGDIVFALDGQRFTNPGDLVSHFDQTTVDYIESSGNARQTGNISLPPQNP